MSKRKQYQDTDAALLKTKGEQLLLEEKVGMLMVKLDALLVDLILEEKLMNADAQWVMGSDGSCTLSTKKSQLRDLLADYYDNHCEPGEELIISLDDGFYLSYCGSFKIEDDQIGVMADLSDELPLFIKRHQLSVSAEEKKEETSVEREIAELEERLSRLKRLKTQLPQEQISQ